MRKLAKGEGAGYHRWEDEGKTQATAIRSNGIKLNKHTGSQGKDGGDKAGIEG